MRPHVGLERARPRVRLAADAAHVGATGIDVINVVNVVSHVGARVGATRNRRRSRS